MESITFLLFHFFLPPLPGQLRHPLPVHGFLYIQHPLVPTEGKRPQPVYENRIHNYSTRNGIVRWVCAADGVGGCDSISLPWFRQGGKYSIFLEVALGTLALPPR